MADVKKKTSMAQKKSEMVQIKHVFSTYDELPDVHKEFFIKTFALGVDGLKKKFRESKGYMPPGATTEAYHANAGKNRYPDVLCLDDTRVTLKRDGSKSEGYIHANFVSGGKGRKFIATQGPSEPTVVDFWAMIWQENTSVILMLCQVMETGRKKCEQYWPEKNGQTLIFGKVSVRKSSEEMRYLSAKQNLVVSTLEVALEGQPPRTITHFIWPDWPDRSIPRDTLQVMKIRRHVTEALKEASTAVVHCSAGIGRTGTFLVLDLGMDVIETKPAKAINVDQILETVRTERLHSVQTEVQYVFIHMALIDYLLRRQRIFNMATVPGYDKFHAAVLSCIKEPVDA